MSTFLFSLPHQFWVDTFPSLSSGIPEFCWLSLLPITSILRIYLVNFFPVQRMNDIWLLTSGEILGKFQISFVFLPIFFFLSPHTIFHDLKFWAHLYAYTLLYSHFSTHAFFLTHNNLFFLNNFLKVFEKALAFL